MSRRLTELCTTLVKEFFGDTAANIFRTIATRGRSNLLVVRRYVGKSRHFNESLATLIRHHILFHNDTNGDEISSFQVDWHGAYGLIRLHKIGHAVALRFGEDAGHVADRVAQLGHISVADLEQDFSTTEKIERVNGVSDEPKHNLTNGTVKGAVDSNAADKESGKRTMPASRLHGSLKKLLKSGFLIVVNERTYVSPADLEEIAKKEIIRQEFPDGKVTGPKKSRQFQAAVERLKDEWREKDECKLSEAPSKLGLKRSSPPLERPENKKRRKIEPDGNLTNGNANDTHDGDQEYETDTKDFVRVPANIILRLNHLRVVKALRSERLESLATQYLGHTTGSVYGSLLQFVECDASGQRESFKFRPNKRKSEDNDDEDGEDSVNGDDTRHRHDSKRVKVLEHLDCTIDPSTVAEDGTCLDQLSRKKVKHRNKKDGIILDEQDAAELGIKLESASESGSDDGGEANDLSTSLKKDRKKRWKVFQAHLGALEEHQDGFLLPSAGSDRIEVPIKTLDNTLLETEIQEMISARFGSAAGRIYRVLRAANGDKLPEKAVWQRALLREKYCKAILTAMQYHGLVDCAEIPATEDRRTDRCEYLWFLEEDTVRTNFLQHIYRAMTRLLERIEVESTNGAFGGVLDKVEKLDIKGLEEEIYAKLTKRELEIYKDGMENRAKLYVQLDRMDMVVAVLRDFDGEDISLFV